MHVIFSDPDSNSELLQIDLSDSDRPLLTLCKEQVCPMLDPPRTFRLYGKMCTMRRLQKLFCVDPEKKYRYSGTDFAALPMTPELLQLLGLVNARCGANFNSILVNHYRDGSDYISAHADDEAGLDPVAGVVTISCGATRLLQIRRKGSDRTVVAQVPLMDGRLVQMRGSDFQKKFSHGIPIEKRVVGERTSFTFRHLL